MHRYQPATSGRFTTAALSAAATFAAAWFVLLGDDPASWIIGVPCILACAWLNGFMARAQGPRLSISGWLRLIPYFVRQSIGGGWDVARRSLAPSLPVRPGFLMFDLQLPPGAARSFFVQLIGLLPGTLSVALQGDRLVVHSLTLDTAPEASLRAAEQRVAQAFALRTEH